MTKKELNMQLIKYLPEIEELYIEEVSWQEGNETGSHVVFGDVLVPYIIQKVHENNIPSLRKCLNTVETLLMLDDDYTTEVITLSVLESLSCEKALFSELIKYMGEKTKEIFKTFFDKD